MRREVNCDVLVVGAGPAGSTAAKWAAKHVCSVLLIDRKARIGQPVRCAEYVPRLIRREVRLDERAIVQSVEEMVTHLPDGREERTSAPGFILDRSVFDASLALDAVDAGATLLSNTRAVALDCDKVLARRGGEDFIIRPKVVIGADGPGSLVARSMGSGNREFVYALQYQIGIDREFGETHVFFDRRCAGGYAWFFPRGRLANVGVGVNLKFGVRPREVLNSFLAELRRGDFISGENVLASTAGLIPVGGYHPRMSSGNILLVGDAAGQTDPITGAGIPQAVICGRIAGDVAGRAIESNDMKLLERYEAEWREYFGFVLDRALERRRFLDAHWYDGNFCEMLKTTWVAFREYYRRCE
ncbi:MAG: NAD(P)/FAD-dependent oxidoreductase [bacterium]